jgi:hypothetical protein
MRIIFMVVLLAACAHHAEGSSAPPRGEEVLYALLKNDDVLLSAEPLCNADMKLYEQLALALSVSYDSENTTVIKSSCLPSKFERNIGNIENVWDCTIQINENSSTGEYISSSTFVLSLTKDSKKFIKGSLRCY